MKEGNYLFHMQDVEDFLEVTFEKNLDFLLEFQ